MAGFHHGGHHGQVLSCQFRALSQCPDAVSDLQTGIPETRDELFQLASRTRVWRLLSEDEHVDIRLRKQLASAVTAYSNQRSRRIFSHVFQPKSGQHRVDHVTGSPEERRNRLTRREVLGQGFAPCLQETPGR